MNFVPVCGEDIRFRKAENIKRALDGELYFYSRVFGFELAEEVEPVEIETFNEPIARPFRHEIKLIRISCAATKDQRDGLDPETAGRHARCQTQTRHAARSTADHAVRKLVRA